MTHLLLVIKTHISNLTSLLLMSTVINQIKLKIWKRKNNGENKFIHS